MHTKNVPTTAKEANTQGIHGKEFIAGQSGLHTPTDRHSSTYNIEHSNGKVRSSNLAQVFSALIDKCQTTEKLFKVPETEIRRGGGGVKPKSTASKRKRNDDDDYDNGAENPITKKRVSKSLAPLKRNCWFVCLQYMQGDNPYQDERRRHLSSKFERRKQAFKRHIRPNNSDQNGTSTDVCFPEKTKWQSNQWRYSDAPSISKERSRVSASVHAIVGAPNKFLQKVVRQQKMMRREQEDQPQVSKRTQSKTSSQRLSFMGLKGIRRP